MSEASRRSRPEEDEDDLLDSDDDNAGQQSQASARAARLGKLANKRRRQRQVQEEARQLRFGGEEEEYKEVDGEKYVCYNSFRLSIVALSRFLILEGFSMFDRPHSGGRGSARRGRF
jgi:hypothetical protein